VIVGNESQIIRELSTHKPIMYSEASAPVAAASAPAVTIATSSTAGNSKQTDEERPSLLDVGRQAAKLAETEYIQRVLQETRWNRRQAAKILKISYKALLNKMKLIEEQNAQSRQPQT
jgi:two-component system response regulator AtoC